MKYLISYICFINCKNEIDKELRTTPRISNGGLLVVLLYALRTIARVPRQVIALNSLPAGRQAPLLIRENVCINGKRNHLIDNKCLMN